MHDRFHACTCLSVGWQTAVSPARHHSADPRGVTSDYPNPSCISSPVHLLVHCSIHHSSIRHRVPYFTITGRALGHVLSFHVLRTSITVVVYMYTCVKLCIINTCTCLQSHHREHNTKTQTLAAYFVVLPVRDEAGVVLGASWLPTLFTTSLILTSVASPALSGFLGTFPGRKYAQG